MTQINYAKEQIFNWLEAHHLKELKEDKEKKTHLKCGGAMQRYHEMKIVFPA